MIKRIKTRQDKGERKEKKKKGKKKGVNAFGGAVSILRLASYLVFVHVARPAAQTAVLGGNNVYTRARTHPKDLDSCLVLPANARRERHAASLPYPLPTYLCSYLSLLIRVNSLITLPSPAHRTPPFFPLVPSSGSAFNPERAQAFHVACGIRFGLVLRLVPVTEREAVPRRIGCEVIASGPVRPLGFPFSPAPSSPTPILTLAVSQKNMHRHSSAYPIEAMNMHAIPSVYFRPPSPHKSRASTSHPAVNMTIPMHVHMTSVRSSASAAANHRLEKERRVPMAPMMRERSSSGSSSSKTHTSSSSHHSEHVPQAKVSTSTSSSSSASSRARSRRQSTSKSSKPQSTTSSQDDRSGAPPNSIPHLREALTSLESQMESLMYERRMLESRLEQAVRQQSPVLRLPGELLGSIFEIGVHHMEEEDSLLLSTLMLVCKEWTDVALNTPVLWSRITIDGHKAIPRARRKLSRSKAAPLDISIQFGPDTEGTQAVIELVVHALDLLRPAIWRWRSFRLAVPTRAHAHAALAQCCEPAPMLQVLAVQVHQVLQDDRQGRSGTSASSAARAAAALLPLFQGRMPNLRTCAFTSFNFGWDVTLVSRLRVLRLGGFWNGCAPSVATIVSVLRACPGLEELALRNMSDVESGFCSDFDAKEGQMASGNNNNVLFPKESDMVCLPRLRKASFYYAGIERMQAVFSQLLFPALERVEFSYMDNLTPIIKHLKRQSFSSLPLVQLRIESCFFNELKLVRLLRRLPTLQTLELVDVEDISSNFLNGLSAPSGTQDWICPNLETLNFDGCSAVAWDALRGLVEARLPSSVAARLLSPPNAAFARGNTTFVSSASAYAAQQPRTGQMEQGGISRGWSAVLPKRLRVVDLTRCQQINKEMVQWLRMYVAEVRCESAKTYWGEFGFLS
ncbi:hypothetical protein M0805_001472 [Coniferiporia weirii]|nr:hypothetical protein M0805_001472 [Coniferiporia weirii]